MADGTQGIAASQAKKDARDSTAKCQQHTFGKQLTDETKARAAEGGANGHLALARGGTHEQKIGDVDASEDQNKSGKDQEEDGHLQDGLVGVGSWTGEALWEDADRHAFFSFWIFFCEAVADDVESGLRLLQGDLGTQARVESKIAEASIGRDVLLVRAIHLLHAKGQVTLDVDKGAHAVKLPWRDANDGDGATVIEDGFANDARIATEARLPEGIAENDDGIQRGDGAFLRKNEASK